MSASHNSSEKKKEKKLDVFDELSWNLWKFNHSASQDKFQDYCSKQSHDIEKTTALKWWYQNQQRKCWSRLSYMILDVLSISAMSDESERVFSEACWTVSWDRAQMTAETLECVKCLKHWKRIRILNEWFNIE